MVVTGIFSEDNHTKVPDCGMKIHGVRDILDVTVRQPHPCLVEANKLIRQMKQMIEENSAGGQTGGYLHEETKSGQ